MKKDSSRTTPVASVAQKALVLVRKRQPMLTSQAPARLATVQVRPARPAGQLIR
jgi:hypothetical protein